MIFAPSDEILERAAARLRAGGLVAFPTETVYGIGADATNAMAVANIFAIKGRPAFDPLIVHVGAVQELESVASVVPPLAMRLVQRFWPGPLTVVLPKADRIPDIVTAGLGSVAVRAPDHPVAQALLRAAGCPVAAPSANPFGYISPTTPEHVARQLGNRVDMILDGGRCRIGVESTIVSFLEDTPRLLRPGGLPLEEIEPIVGALCLERLADRILAPGQLPRHYAPAARVAMIGAPAEVLPEARDGAALLLPAPTDDTHGFAHVELLSQDGDLAVVAANLFAALRRLDEGPYHRIYAVRVAEVGLGRAIGDRLRRASAR